MVKEVWRNTMREEHQIVSINYYKLAGFFIGIVGATIGAFFLIKILT